MERPFSFEIKIRMNSASMQINKVEHEGKERAFTTVALNNDSHTSGIEFGKILGNAQQSLSNIARPSGSSHADYADYAEQMHHKDSSSLQHRESSSVQAREGSRADVREADVHSAEVEERKDREATGTESELAEQSSWNEEDARVDATAEQSGKELDKKSEQNSSEESAEDSPEDSTDKFDEEDTEAIDWLSDAASFTNEIFNPINVPPAQVDSPSMIDSESENDAESSFKTKGEQKHSILKEKLEKNGRKEEARGKSGSEDGAWELLAEDSTADRESEKDQTIFRRESSTELKAGYNQQSFSGEKENQSGSQKSPRKQTAEAVQTNTSAEKSTNNEYAGLLNTNKTVADRIASMQTESTRGSSAEQKEIFNRLVEKARMNLGPDGRSSASIRLNPPHLGRMTLNLQMHNNRMQARLLVDSEPVRKMIMAELEGLRQELKTQGIQVENFTVKLREPMNAFGPDGQYNSDLNKENFFDKNAQGRGKDSDSESSGSKNGDANSETFNGEADSYETNLDGRISEHRVNLSI